MDLALSVLLLVPLIAWVLWRRSRLRRRRRPSRPAPDVTDATQQLAFVSRASFERQPLLNKGEFQVLLLLEEVVRELMLGYRVMAQTCLGEILRPKLRNGAETENDLAYRSINSKRVDFVIVDRRGLPVLAVEYHGTGHYQGNAHLRDAVKRTAFHSAGVHLIEVTARFDENEIARQVRAILGAAQARAESGSTRIGSGVAARPSKRAKWYGA